MTDQEHQERGILVEKAITIIEGTHLLPDDKKLLIGRVPFVADKMLQVFIQICEEDPLAIDAVVKNLKQKLDAQGNLKKIHEIVRQERIEMEELIAEHA